MLSNKLYPHQNATVKRDPSVAAFQGQGQGQGFFICHIIVIQGITRSEMQSNQVRSVDSAKQ